MSEKIEYWVNRLFFFDRYYEYSDDHSVWKAGVNAKAKLNDEAKNAQFTEHEGTEILRLLGEKWDTAYRECKRKYGDVVNDLFWNEGSGPDLKAFAELYIRRGSIKN